TPRASAGQRGCPKSKGGTITTASARGGSRRQGQGARRAASACSATASSRAPSRAAPAAAFTWRPTRAKASAFRCTIPGPCGSTKSRYMASPSRTRAPSSSQAPLLALWNWYTNTPPLNVTRKRKARTPAATSSRSRGDASGMEQTILAMIRRVSASPPGLSLILPAYRENGRLGATLAEARALLDPPPEGSGILAALRAAGGLRGPGGRGRGRGDAGGGRGGGGARRAHHGAGRARAARQGPGRARGGGAGPRSRGRLHGCRRQGALRGDRRRAVPAGAGLRRGHRLPARG